MTFNRLRLEYALEGNSNFNTWKDHMSMVVDDNGFLKYVKTNIAKPGSVDAQNLAKWKKDVARDKRIILEGVRDHIVSKLHGKETPFATWKTPNDLLKNSNESMKLDLMNKLRIEDKGYEVVFRDGKA